jgi:hypothetical protein
LPYGAKATDRAAEASASNANPIVIAWQALGRAVKVRDFWILFGSFFICGLSTNGLIGTHFISFCIDGGIPEVRAAGVLAMMGVFDLVGTTLSGWLSDRYDNRRLLAWYYGLRVFPPLPAVLGLHFLEPRLFRDVLCLDWIATVPPTLRITSDIFGKRDAPVIFGWIFTGHQIGAGRRCARRRRNPHGVRRIHRRLPDCRRDVRTRGAHSACDSPYECSRPSRPRLAADHFVHDTVEHRCTLF